MFLHNVLDTSKLNAEYLDLEESDVSGSMTVVVPEMKTNIKNMTCILENTETKTFSCALLNNDEKFYLLELQFDPNVKKINLLTYMSYYNYKLLVGGAISLSKNYIAVTGQDLSSRTRKILLYSRKVKNAQRRALSDLQSSQKLNGRVLQKAQTPEHPYLFYSLDLPIQHTEVPLTDYQFFLYQKQNQIKNPDEKSDIKTITKTEDKLAVQTVKEPGMAKIYSISNAEIVFKKMGFYEMQDMKKVAFEFEGGAKLTKKGLFQVFFDEEAIGNINTQDKQSWDGVINFVKNLKYLGVGFLSVVVITGLLVSCYCLRRETLKGSLDE